MAFAASVPSNMTPQRLLQHIEDLLVKLGVEVRTESFDPRWANDHSSRGGICRLHNRTIVVVEANAPIAHRIAVLAAAAATLDTESVLVPPLVREVIEAHRQGAPLDIKRPALRLVESPKPTTHNKKRG